MARDLPGECAHGYINDWGDFGCQCGPDGTCLDPSGHNPVEWCPEGCNDDAPRTP